MNVFKSGTGTITISEAGSATPLYTKSKIPLTPGPLVVTIKVASSLVANSSAYWPPTLPDSVETIAASYVQPGTDASVRLFNLSPDTKMAGMKLGGKAIASGVAYSLGSPWSKVPATTESFGFVDSGSGKTLLSKTETPPKAPIGATNFLLGVQNPGGGVALGLEVVSLRDAPEVSLLHSLYI
eukprot:SAG31_NODE_11225_length_1052_cov_1.125918_1_plen_183_part_00